MTDLELMMAEAPLIKVRKEKDKMKKEKRKHRSEVISRPPKAMRPRRY